MHSKTPSAGDDFEKWWLNETARLEERLRRDDDTGSAVARLKGKGARDLVAHLLRTARFAAFVLAERGRPRATRKGGIPKRHVDQARAAAARLDANLSALSGLNVGLETAISTLRELDERLEKAPKENLRPDSERFFENEETVTVLSVVMDTGNPHWEALALLLDRSLDYVGAPRKNALYSSGATLRARLKRRGVGPRSIESVRRARKIRT